MTTRMTPERLKELNLSRCDCSDPICTEKIELLAHIDALVEELYRVTVDYEEANEGLHKAREACNATSEEVHYDIILLVEERDELARQNEIYKKSITGAVNFLESCGIYKTDSAFNKSDPEFQMAIDLKQAIVESEKK